MNFGSECKLGYSKEFSNTCPLVLEATSDVIEAIVGGTAYVKLDTTGVAFLATDTMSYRLRQQDNSNTQLVVSSVPGSNQSEIICGATGIVYADLILTDAVPDYEISKVFRKHGDETRMAHLLYETIWSKSQVLNHLKMVEFYYMEGGFWKYIPDDVYFSMMDLILNACAIVGVSEGGGFNSEQVWMTLSEEDGGSISLTLVQYLMSRLGNNFDNNGETEWPLTMFLNGESVQIFRAHQILRKYNVIGVDNFVHEWNKCINMTVGSNEGITVELAKAVKGRAYVEGEKIFVLDERSLPVEINTRISKLFTLKHRWNTHTLHELVRPFLAVKPEVFLLKMCKLIDDDVYVARFTP